MGDRCGRETKIAAGLNLVRTIALTACIAGPGHADCTAVVGTSFLLEQDGSIREINFFPIITTTETMTYVACPVVSDGNGGDVTDCHIGIADRDGGPVTMASLGTCTAQRSWSPDCPDFTAEGFTDANRTALERLVRAEDLTCPLSPARDLWTSRRVEAATDCWVSIAPSRSR